MNLSELLVCTASKQKDARFWGAPSAGEVIWPKGACYHIYFLLRQTRVLEKGKIRMRPRKKSHSARGCLVSLFSPSSGQQCFALLVQIQAWSQFLCSRWQKNAGNSKGFLSRPLAAGMFTQRGWKDRHLCLHFYIAGSPKPTVRTHLYPSTSAPELQQHRLSTSLP